MYSYQASAIYIVSGHLKNPVVKSTNCYLIETGNKMFPIF